MFARRTQLLRSLSAAVAVGIALQSSLWGQIYNPANGHYYQYVSVPTGLDWFTAEVAANAMEFQGIPGGFNLDGTVDGRDFLAWQRNSSVGSLSDWQANYGTSSLNAAVSVPEPASCLLCLLGVIALANRSRHLLPKTR